jgi:phage repressor protein C with HTH and peptisase S24 domain
VLSRGGLWEETYMTDDAPSPLQEMIQRAIDQSGKTRDFFDSRLREMLGTTGKPLYDIHRGKSKKPTPVVLRAIEKVLKLGGDSLVNLVHPRSAPEPDLPPSRSADAGETVQIIRLDLSLPMGPGATVDDYIESEPFTFDLAYVRSFSRTPAHRLRIATGVGDSMFPTLISNDLVWIDSTQNVLNQSDKIWAVSINGGAAIKRLRTLKGGRVGVISDNPLIENYEVDADEILIGGRVIRFGRDL